MTVDYEQFANDAAPRAATERPLAHSVLAGLGAAAAAFGAGALGTLAMRGKGSPDGLWFRRLRKPSFQPPNWLFGPVWTILYATIAYSGWRIWKAPKSRERTSALSLWGAQLVLNAAWTPLFFGARKPALALADLVALDAAAAAYAATARKVDRQAAVVVTPYLGWLGFATALNTVIAVKNR